MTNKEKLEIIDKALDELYKILQNGVKIFVTEIRGVNANFPKDITQSIYNLEATKLLLEPLPNLPTIYECCNCGKQIECYGEFIKGECLKCGCALVKKED